ncbi:response regulator [Qipengyuania aquimaris]|uniref:response regulator n=1 Tax=Qipengyuania aquimaris TaxID=255984 RepID=UPI001FD42401|nr:response regulator [Qipengyuania aquimaris]UOR15117.1 response regulator [Qipengyuania aquimaris]
MSNLDDLPPDKRAEILASRLDRSERALRAAETALEQRMKELFKANEELSLRESELAQKLEVESSLLLGALSTTQMATAYGERDRGFTVSEGAARLLGLAQDEEATLEKLVSALHPLDRDRIMREGLAFFRDGEPGKAHHYEHRIQRKDTGETRWLSWTIRREAGVDGRPSHLFATVRDITEERANERQVRALQLRAERRVAELARLQFELSEAKRRVDRALEGRNRFISEMAHAVRTPLAALSGALELLRLKAPSELSDDLSVAREASEQLGEFASKLIEEAALEEGAHVADLAAPEAPAPQSDAAMPLPDNPKVLIAEDTVSNRYVAERLLAELGCEVTSVDNGAAAVEAVRRDGFDVVLMDVMMPIMNGEQATQAIRALGGPASRTPIIGVTAHSLQSERERLLSSGMTACLSKPVRKDTLETALRTALISGRDMAQDAARFDHDLFRRAFTDLPEAYRERMRDAAKKDITRYAADVLSAVERDDDSALSKAAHSLTGVSLNIGAIGIVEELAAYREKRPAPEASTEEFRSAVASCLLAVDDLYFALVEKP